MLERENQSLYKDFVLTREQTKDMQVLIQEQERQKAQLEQACEQMTEVVSQVQNEVAESQRAVEHLNAQLERMRRKNEKYQDCKRQLRLQKAHEQQLVDIIEGLRRQMHPS